jgi:proline racemase
VTDLTLATVEVHAEGEACRVVLDGDRWVEGETIEERFAYCREHLDGLRRLMLHEPRGAPALCGVLVLPPSRPEADLGIVVVESAGFTPMSGSNTMCAVTALLETGVLAKQEPVTEVVIETAVGTVRAEAAVVDGRVRHVTVHNVPAYVVELGRVLDVPGLGEVTADVVFGGQFFVQVRAPELGLDITPDNARALVDAGARIKRAAARQLDLQHPTHPDIRGIDLVMFLGPARSEGADAQNTVVLTGSRLTDDPSTWTGALDRSPCGTGTCGRMAALHARGELAIDAPFVHESVIGTRFVGRLTGTTTVGGRPAVLPTITGRAWVTGRSEWTLDPTDPFPTGFTVGDVWPPG